MIQYTLKCDQGHSFDSWFKSSGAFDKLRSAGLVECAQCGSADVQKAIMAPSVRPARNSTIGKTSDTAATPGENSNVPVMSTADPKAEAMLREMKAQVEANSDYVGPKFAQEARAMHLGDAPDRAIYGEANAQEAKALLEDGVPVMPLPFKPTKQTN